MDSPFNDRSGQRQSSAKRQGSFSGESRLTNKKSLTRTNAGNGPRPGLRLDAELDTRDDQISDLKSQLDKLQRACTCVICNDLLFEPFSFQCGHTYCYGVSQCIPGSG